MMNAIAASSPTAGLPMDDNTGAPVDLSLEDFDDEDLSEILHDKSETQWHSYTNDNFKIGRKSHILLQRRRKKASKKTENQKIHRSFSVSEANTRLKGTVCRRPRPTTLNFFAEPARPGPLPSSYFPECGKSRSVLPNHNITETNSPIMNNNNNNNPTSTSRLKSTFSAETIKNNNTETENGSQLQNASHENTSCHPSSKDEALAPKVSVEATATSTTNTPRDQATSHVSRTLPRYHRYDVTQSISSSGLTRSASEWSIEDPDKVEYCFFNGEVKEQTHTALFKFVPRHQDEILLEISDPLHVVNQADDFWFEGINMRTGKQGIFPSYYAQSLLDFTDKVSEMSLKEEQTDQFNIYFLGSVEVACHKGNDVLCHAMYKVAQARRVTIHKLPPAYVCLLVSSNGIKMMDQSQLRKQRVPDNPYFNFSSCSTVKHHIHYFHLRNVSFCGHHPKNDKYFAFITRHPQSPSRFACHVFVSDVSTRPLAECIGRAFEAFYHQFMNNSHPAEDIYIE